MAKPTPFVLPAGLELDLDGSELVVRYDGDVVLEQSLGRTIERIEVGGDLVVRMAKAAGTLKAGGKLVITGAVDADILRGREVHLGKKPIRARAIAATERIVIGAAPLQVDVIVAPDIQIDGKASGRVTVIESNNERGPTRIKGGFTLAEYEELFGDAHAFLADREVGDIAEMLHGAAGLGARADDTATVTDSDEEDDAIQVVELDHTLEPEPSSESIAPADEDTDDPLSLSAEDLTPVTDEPVTPHTLDDSSAEDEPTATVDDEIHPKLLDAVRRIASCYEGRDVPPAVAQLRALVDARDYAALRTDITQVWNGLLGFHQRMGIRPHHQVTHAFNVIHGLVQDTAR